MITELVASNDAGLTDDDGQTPDWVEIWNPGTEAVDLEGWYLSDDEGNPTKWAFPSRELGPDSYLVVFASGKDRAPAGGELHSNFELDRTGEYLALSQGPPESPVIASEFAPYPRQFEDISYGLTGGSESDVYGYYESPTPDAANGGTFLEDYVRDTQFSYDRGYYDTPFEVEVTTSTPGATIYYTTDGTPPGPGNGSEVQATDDQTPPIAFVNVDGTTTLRAMAAKPGYLPTNVDTHTYLFPEHVLQQSGRGAPYDQAANWGHAGPDWEMDPEIVQDGNPEVRPVPEDLKRIATLSLVLDFDEMFGSDGIYIAGQSEERDTSIELINPENSVDQPNAVDGFQVNGTVQIVGGSSPNRWKSDKLSMRVKFQPDLEYPVFGREATDRFDTLVLDARLNNVWHYGGGSEPSGQRGRAQYVRDQYAANLHNAMGGYSPHGRHVHLFLNGIYWGIVTLHERPDDNFAASYLGGENEDYDSLKHNPNDLLQGTSENYNQLHSLADRNLADDANYQAVAAMLDVDRFITYMLVNFYVGNGDWAHHNWYASFNRVDPDGRWRFHSWDAEKGLHRVGDNVTGRDDSGAPTALHQELVDSPEYRLRFADLAYHHLRHGVLTPETAAQMYREITDPIDLVMRLESARWGDNQRSRPFTRVDWLNIRDQIFGLTQDTSGPLYDYFNQRSEIVLGQFRNRGWLPALVPPTFNQHGGTVSKEFNLAINANQSGTLYYTLDGSDPRIPGQGGDVTVTTLIGEDTEKRAFMPQNAGLEGTWFASDFDDGAWPMGNQGAGYENNSGYQGIIDSDLDFGREVSPGEDETIYMRVEFEVDNPDAFDGLELRMRYDDGFVAYLNGEEIARANAPGGAGSEVPWDGQANSSHSDNEAVDFQAFNVGAGLDYLRSGRNVLAVHGLNVNADSSDFLIWSTLYGTQTEGGTPSSVRPSAQEYAGPFSLEESAVVKARLKNGTEWSPLLQADFLVEAVPAEAGSLVITRIHYHPVPPNQEEEATGFTGQTDFEFLELMNISQEAIDLRQVRFVDGVEFTFEPDGPVKRLEPGQRATVVANLLAYEMRYIGPFGGAAQVAGEFKNQTNLANGGERIALVDAQDELILEVTYADQTPWPEEADGMGYSLALKDPESNPEPNDPGNWTANPEAGADRNGEPAGPVEQWLVEHFSQAELDDPAISGLEADPEGDGLPNLFEYFHRNDPKTAEDASRLLTIDMSTELAGAQVQLSFVKRDDAEGVTWTVSGSNDLSEWNPVAFQEDFVAEPNADGTETMQVGFVPEAEARYFRLELTLNQGE